MEPPNQSMNVEDEVVFETPAAFSASTESTRKETSIV